MVIRSFEESCEKAGGKYDVEYGALESDVGLPHGVEAEETKKEWCTVEGETREAIVFYAAFRRHVELKARPKQAASMEEDTNIRIDSDTGFDVEDMGAFGGRGFCFTPKGRYAFSICLNTPIGGWKEPRILTDGALVV